MLRSAQTIRFYAVEGQSFTGETFVNDDPDMVVYSQREPLGVVTVISPWNFPISIPARKIAPALAAGCTVVCKPAEDTPLTSLALVLLAQEAGVPAGVLNIVTASREKTPEVVDVWLDDARVRKITFTGSTLSLIHI